MACFLRSGGRFSIGAADLSVCTVAAAVFRIMAVASGYGNHGGGDSFVFSFCFRLEKTEKRGDL